MTASSGPEKKGGGGVFEPWLAPVNLNGFQLNKKVGLLQRHGAQNSGPFEQSNRAQIVGLLENHGAQNSGPFTEPWRAI